MNIKILLRSAFHSLAKHPLRSLLTTLGIIIGITAIIAVTSIGQGAKYKVQQSIEKLGSNFIIVLGGESKSFSQRRGGGAQVTLKTSDYKAIVDECEYIYQASPGIQAPVRCIVEGTNWQTIMGGTYPNYTEIRNWPIAHGENFTDNDVRSATKVAILGNTVSQQLFGTTNPLGKTIRIKNIPFKIIGMLSEKGKRPDGTDEDDIVIAPFTTVQRKIVGARKFSAIIMSATTKQHIGKATQQVRDILRQKHRLTPTDTEDF
ncbi:MAG TPA: ABC transporter permease, partial [Flavobacteriales bacterium]|nr:ABC transporter permease [Flavobacteriales bacterium]